MTGDGMTGREPDPFDDPANPEHGTVLDDGGDAGGADPFGSHAPGASGGAGADDGGSRPGPGWSAWDDDQPADHRTQVLDSDEFGRPILGAHDVLDPFGGPGAGGAASGGPGGGEQAAGRDPFAGHDPYAPAPGAPSGAPSGAPDTGWTPAEPVLHMEHEVPPPWEFDAAAAQGTQHQPWQPGGAGGTGGAGGPQAEPGWAPAPDPASGSASAPGSTGSAGAPGASGWSGDQYAPPVADDDQPWPPPPTAGEDPSWPPPMPGRETDHGAPAPGGGPGGGPGGETGAGASVDTGADRGGAATPAARAPEPFAPAAPESWGPGNGSAPDPFAGSGQDGPDGSNPFAAPTGASGDTPAFGSGPAPWSPEAAEDEFPTGHLPATGPAGQDGPGAPDPGPAAHHDVPAPWSPGTADESPTGRLPVVPDGGTPAPGQGAGQQDHGPYGGSGPGGFPIGREDAPSDPPTQEVPAPWAAAVDPAPWSPEPAAASPGAEQDQAGHGAGPGSPFGGGTAWGPPDLGPFGGPDPAEQQQDARDQSAAGPRADHGGLPPGWGDSAAARHDEQRQDAPWNPGTPGGWTAADPNPFGAPPDQAPPNPFGGAAGTAAPAGERPGQAPAGPWTAPAAGPDQGARPGEEPGGLPNPFGAPSPWAQPAAPGPWQQQGQQGQPGQPGQPGQQGQPGQGRPGQGDQGQGPQGAGWPGQQNWAGPSAGDPQTGGFAMPFQGGGYQAPQAGAPAQSFSPQDFAGQQFQGSGAAPLQLPPQQHVPLTSDSLSPQALLRPRKAPPQGGWRRAVFKVSGGLIDPGESSKETQRQQMIATARTPVDGGHYRVAVLSLKGGVGKTTTTVGLGATLASLRGDRVIAVDANPDRGTLSEKVRLETRANVRNLLAMRDQIHRYADVRQHTSQASSRLEILASDPDPAISEAFSEDDYRAVAEVLEHYYSICITDCGTGLLHSAMRGVLGMADQIVLVSSASVDGARSASATLDWLDAHEYSGLVRDGVVVMSAVRPQNKAVDLSRLEQHFSARCRTLVRVPFDPHLEAGAEFELDQLSATTKDAYLRLAASVALGFQHRVPQ